MNVTATEKSAIVPFSLQDAPFLIEKAWPTAKISAETQKERKAGSGQTLTGLGSYWKGRKPLILTRACVLAALIRPNRPCEICHRRKPARSPWRGVGPLAEGVCKNFR